jgi:Dolichyl-phosphate-mannose-protein mannosyltransferase
MKAQNGPDAQAPNVTNVPRMSLVLFLLALCLTAAVHIAKASAPYTYHHGFMSAVGATSAREFARDGIFQLGGVPVANNPPIGPNDSYTHWPPFLPISLSIWFHLFGVSETAGHLYMLLIQIMTALLIFAIARAWLGSTGGALAGFFWLTLPVVAHYSHVIVAESLAVALMLAALLAFLRLRPRLAALAAFVAVCTSWEAVLLVPGFWAASIATKKPAHRRITLACTAAIALALVSVVTCYALHNPLIFQDALHTALFRMGLSHTYSQRLIVESTERYVGFEESVSRILWNFPRMLGFFGSSGLVLLGISRPKGSTSIVCVLGVPWLLWCILMRNHMAVHDIEMQLAAPLAAIALAWIAIGVMANGVTGIKAWTVLALTLLVIAIQPWLLGIEASPEDPQQILGFAAGIRRATSSDDVILSPLVSAIPLYYSQRHIIRCISDESMMKQVLPYVRSQYPKARLYWATPLYAQPWVTVTEVR